MTKEQLDRLRELEELDSDGVKLSSAEYTELNELLRLEDAHFCDQHDWNTRNL